LHRRILNDLALEGAPFEGTDLHSTDTAARLSLARIGLARYAEELGIWTTYRIAAAG